MRAKLALALLLIAGSVQAQTTVGPVPRSLIGAPNGVAPTDGSSLVPLANLPIVSVAKGGTGTASPGLVQGSNITITGTWPNQTISAPTASGLAIAHSQHGGAAGSISATDWFVSTANNSDFAASTGTWTGAATWTLPAHGTVTDGRPFYIADDAAAGAGVLSNTKTLTIAAASGDTINGGASITLNSAQARLSCFYNATLSDYACSPSLPAGSTAQLLVGQGSTNAPAFQTVSGDGTFSSLGALTVSKVNGVTVNGTPSASQSIVASNSTTAAWGLVPVAGLGTQAANTLIANATGSTAQPTASTLSAYLDSAAGSSAGSMLVRGSGGTWAASAPTATGQCAVANGSNIPTWTSCPSTGTGVSSINVAAGLTPTKGSSGGTISTAAQTIYGQQIINDQSAAGSAYAIADTDDGKLVKLPSSGASIAAAGASGNMAAGWRTKLFNNTAGAVNLTLGTSATVNGSSTSPITVAAGSGIELVSSGSNDYTGYSSGGGGTPLVIRNYFEGLEMYQDGASLTKLNIRGGSAMDTTNSTLMTTAGCSIDLGAANGAGALDTGTVSTAQYLGIFLINGTSGTSCIASARTNSAITGAAVTAGSTNLTTTAAATLPGGATVVLKDDTNGNQSLVLATTGGGTSATTFTLAKAANRTESASTGYTVYYSGTPGDGPVLPTGYSKYRLIGQMRTSATTATNWTTFSQVGDVVMWGVPKAETASVAASTTVGTPTTLGLFSVPLGMYVEPILRVGSSSAGLSIQSANAPALAALPGTTNSGSNPGTDLSETAGHRFPDGTYTDLYGNIKLQAAAANNVTITTIGWRYLRNRRVDQ